MPKVICTRDETWGCRTVPDGIPSPECWRVGRICKYAIKVSDPIEVEDVDKILDSAFAACHVLLIQQQEAFKNMAAAFEELADMYREDIGERDFILSECPDDGKEHLLTMVAQRIPEGYITSRVTWYPPSAGGHQQNGPGGLLPGNLREDQGGLS